MQWQNEIIILTLWLCCVLWDHFIHFWTSQLWRCTSARVCKICNVKSVQHTRAGRWVLNPAAISCGINWQQRCAKKKNPNEKTTSGNAKPEVLRICNGTCCVPEKPLLTRQSQRLQRMLRKKKGRTADTHAGILNLILHAGTRTHHVTAGRQEGKRCCWYTVHPHRGKKWDTLPAPDPQLPTNPFQTAFLLLSEADKLTPLVSKQLALFFCHLHQWEKESWWWVGTGGVFWARLARREKYICPTELHCRDYANVPCAKGPPGLGVWAQLSYNTVYKKPRAQPSGNLRGGVSRPVGQGRRKAEQNISGTLRRRRAYFLSTTERSASVSSLHLNDERELQYSENAELSSYTSKVVNSRLRELLFWVVHFDHLTIMQKCHSF